MNERLQELYREAIEFTNSDEYLDMPRKQLQRLILTKYAELVRQDEREACAKLCEDLQLTGLAIRDWADGTYDCAAAIRARIEL